MAILGQVKGVDPVTNEIMVYRVDDSGKVVGRWNPGTKSWQGQPFVCPVSFGPVISKQESQEAVQYFLQNGFKPVSGYITIGDEPSGKFVTDFEKFITKEESDTFYGLLQSMPREYLRAWFMKSLYPRLEGAAIPFKDADDSRIGDLYGEKVGGKKKDEDLVWGAIIDFFNRANMDYCNQFQIEPWAWEEEKMRLFVVSQNKDKMAEMQKNFDETVKTLTSKEMRKNQIIARYNKLAKSPDAGLEISRQFAINEMLKRDEFEMAEGVIDTYESAAKAGVVPEAVPYDLKVGDEFLKKTPGT